MKIILLFQVTQRDIIDIELNTREQSKSVLWMSERAWRLTASKFGDILKATVRRDMDKLCRTIVFPRQLSVKAIVHGRKYEKTAIRDFELKSCKKVKCCGLFIDPIYNFLAASPDGLIGGEELIEIKCPYKGFGKKICANRDFPFLYINPSDKRVHLRTDCKYYYQVQGQLGITSRERCYFVVFTGTDLFIEKIDFDFEYWNICMVPKLALFYEKHLRPFISRNCW